MSSAASCLIVCHRDDSGLPEWDPVGSLALVVSKWIAFGDVVDLSGNLVGKRSSQVVDETTGGIMADPGHCPGAVFTRLRRRSPDWTDQGVKNTNDRLLGRQGLEP